MTARILSSLSDVSANDWDRCAGSVNPFVSYAFLSALEDSGSATADTGWMPQHIVIEDPIGTVLAAAPLYLKNHSYGEYVFDWGWADAFERAGGHYYPKLQCTVPFTPATGPRFLIRNSVNKTQSTDLYQTLAGTMIQVAKKMKVSSLHITFPEYVEWEIAGNYGFLQRVGQQFHWENRNYTDFEAFLGALTSRKRKQIRKERQRIADTGLKFTALRGKEIKDEHWHAFYAFYLNTTEKKWGPSYLTEEFFQLLGDRLGDSVLLIIAENDYQPVAGALNLIGENTLFGRNWGCNTNYKFLHFETCYYRAIDFAIDHGLKRIEAGAQGHHKIQRGYLPNTTYSAHWIADPNLRQAVSHFISKEREAMKDEMSILANHSPYRDETAD